MKFVVENDKCIRLMSLDLEGNMSTFLIKFKDGVEASECFKAIGQALLKTSSSC